MVLTPHHQRFNIRVYGLLLHEGKVLVNEERIMGRMIIKFPGGGLELGEGTRDCLCREWKEELGLDIQVGKHFYTTDFYQPSAFDNAQVISIYYLVSCPSLPQTFTNNVAGERSFWMSLKDINADTFTLAIDKVVAGILAGHANGKTA